MPEVADLELTAEEKRELLKQYRALLRASQKAMNTGDRERIRQAFEMAVEAHAGTRRKSGEPYILHPVAVARIVASEIGLDTTSIICALLHDTVEDTNVTLEDVEMTFDKKTARIIDGLTKISGVFDLSSNLQAENFRKLLLTLTDDIRVILIKLADRLHNMRTLDSMPRHKQLKIASETAFLYAPIAHRIGLYGLKSELEDLSLKFTEPQMYRLIAGKLSETKRSRTRYINRFIGPIRDILEEKGFDFEIYGRPKSIYSIWNKMKTKGVAFEEVYDLFAIRIILHSPPAREKDDCWTVYSAITNIYTPNPQRLRDWISHPKANGYEALHTTVMGPKGRWVEVQIRSDRMHAIAEKGLAAHWKYKEGRPAEERHMDQWLQSVQDVLNDADQNAIDFVNDFKLNLFNTEIYVFTPKGDLKRLRKGATALDFAYEVHSQVGNRCIGAKVNHKLVPLSHPLENGDQVEILTSTKQTPNEDWLSFVVTSKARNAIRKALKEERRRVAQDGKAILKRTFKKMKVNDIEENMWTVINHYKAGSPTEFFYDLATGKQDLSALKKMEVKNGNIVRPKARKRPAQDKPSVEQAVRKQLSQNAELLIMGESSENIDYSFAQCCSPIPGDDVFGFITINDGIKIHRTNCPNAVQLMSKYSYRIVKTSWTKGHAVAYLTGIRLNGLDDMGVVNKVSQIISNQLSINIKSLSFESTDGVFEGTIMLYVTDDDQLDDMMGKLRTVDGILDIHRFEVADDEVVR